MQHVARILASPLTGVYSTHIDSARQFGRHWHDTYGFGFLEHGAQEWFSGRGIVRGYPGEVIATNPGEVHDGRPLGPPTRSEEHTSELQSHSELVCRLLLEKKNRRAMAIASPA